MKKSYWQSIRRWIFTHRFSLLEIGFLCFAITFRLWLSSNQSLEVIGPAFYDDELYIRHALSIAQGKWLGDYSNTTLIKGVVYPLWIAGMYLLHIPLLLSQQLVFCFSACVLYVLLRQKYRKIFSFFIFCVVLFNPLFYQMQDRVLRYHLCSSFALLISATTFAVTLKRYTYRISPYIILGVLLGFFSLLRDEYYWIIPFIAGVLGYIAFLAYKTNIKLFRLLVRNYVLMAIVIICIVCSIGYINFRTYGVFVISEFTQPAFSNLYGDLMRIKHTNNERYIVIPKETIDAISTVSAQFEELHSYIDIPENSLVTAEYIGHPTNEISGGHFIFILRDAAQYYGHFKDAKTSKRYFESLHREISMACKQKILSCYPFNTKLFTIFH